MFRKLLVIAAVVAISVFCLSGCKKGPSGAVSEQKVLETMAEYEAEAREQINKDNMAGELERIEKALEQELSQEK